MRRNKLRLQLALYARPKHPGMYHYALFVVPKSGQGPITKHHVKNTFQVDELGSVTAPWRNERTVVSDVGAEPRLLVRIVIAKVAKSCDHVQRILESVPVYQVDDLDKAESQSFTCRTCVRDVLRELRRQGAVTAKLEEWEQVERKALEYVDRKQKQRRWSGTRNGGSGVPLMDLLEGKEVVE